jgi:hypothetical protein
LLIPPQLLTFGLPSNFSEAQLKLRFRTLVRYCHPDRNTSQDAQESFELFDFCREILINELQNYKGVKQRMNVVWECFQEKEREG